MRMREFALAVLGAALLAAQGAAQTRVQIPTTNAPGLYPTDGVSVTIQQADTVNLNKFAVDGVGKTLLIAYYEPSDPAVTSVNVSVVSVADPTTGRTGTIVQDALTAYEMHVYGPFAVSGWRQTDGYIYCEADSNRVTFTCITIP